MKGEEKIIDSGVCAQRNGTLKSLALSKKEFALGVLRQLAPFDKMDFSNFLELFNLIEKICNAHRSPNSP